MRRKNIKSLIIVLQVFAFSPFLSPLQCILQTLVHKWPQGSKYTSWLNNLSTAWNDRNGDSILHLSISDIGHIPQCVEPGEGEKKVPVAFALS